MSQETRRRFIGRLGAGFSALTAGQLPFEQTFAAMNRPPAKTPVGVFADNELTCMSRNGELRFICVFNTDKPDLYFTTPDILDPAGERTVITVAAPDLALVRAVRYTSDRSPREFEFTPQVRATEPTVKFSMNTFPDSVTAFDEGGTVIGEERQVKDSFRVFLENQIFPRLNPEG